jgi:hypothetical protein
MKVSEILEQARAKLAAPGGWGQGVFARNKEGIEVGTSAQDAVCFCGSGAVKNACRNLSTTYEYTIAREYLRQIISVKYGFCDIITFNDAAGRTVEEVLEVFDDAIKLAKDAGI